MSKCVLYYLLIVPFFVISQNQQLANSFFEDGGYEKAIIEYDKLIKQQPNRVDFLLKKVTCLQELKAFVKAEKELQKAIIGKYRNPQLWVEIGYNYQLQNDTIKATNNYQKAIEIVKKTATSAYQIGKAFEKYNLLQEAKKTYSIALQKQPALSLNIQLARVYGQLNQIELMFDSYLNQMAKNEKVIPQIQRLISEFIDEDVENEGNMQFKRVLIKKLQNSPNSLWNKQLSWLYIQQKQYHKAFVQEKAVYKRDNQTLQRLFNLGVTAKENENYEMASEIFDFIQTQPLAIETQIQVTNLLLKMEQENSSGKNYSKIIQKYETAIDTFGIQNNTVQLQLEYVNFLAFKAQKIPVALSFLKKNQNQKISKFNKAHYQMMYADILVADSQFNKALINYSKIQRSLKNNVLSQEARFKVAKTSYYKGDFEWALQQLKVLKSSTSQLISNDALDLHLLINDHVKEDSLHVALKKYAKADLLAFQNETQESITVLQDLVENHKGDKIEDDALFLQAKLYEKQANYKAAIANYKFIVKNLDESIFMDDAHYNLAVLYTKLSDEKSAEKEYEIILFNHPDSIYFVIAQKKYRKLRGDDI